MKPLGFVPLHWKSVLYTTFYENPQSLDSHRSGCENPCKEWIPGFSLNFYPWIWNQCCIQETEGLKQWFPTFFSLQQQPVVALKSKVLQLKPIQLKSKHHNVGYRYSQTRRRTKGMEKGSPICKLDTAGGRVPVLVDGSSATVLLRTYLELVVWIELKRKSSGHLKCWKQNKWVITVDSGLVMDSFQRIWVVTTCTYVYWEKMGNLGISF